MHSERFSLKKPVLSEDFPNFSEFEKNIFPAFDFEFENLKKSAELFPENFDISLKPNSYLLKYINDICASDKIKIIEQQTVWEMKAVCVVLSKIKLKLMDDINLNSDIVEVRIIADEIIYIDVDLELRGKNLLLLANKIKIMNNKEVLFNLSGLDGKSYTKKADDGNPNIPGDHGKDGKDGVPGGSGGNMTVVANEIHVNCKWIVKSVGGNGGNGQSGGDGVIGEKGRDGLEYSVEEFKEIFPFKLYKRCLCKSTLNSIGELFSSKLFSTRVEDEYSEMSKRNKYYKTICDIHQQNENSSHNNFPETKNYDIICKNSDSFRNIKEFYFKGVNKEGVELEISIDRRFLSVYKIISEYTYVLLRGSRGQLGGLGGSGGLGGRGGPPGHGGRIEFRGFHKGSLYQIYNSKNFESVTHNLDSKSGSDGLSGESKPRGDPGLNGRDVAYHKYFKRYSFFRKEKLYEPSFWKVIEVNESNIWCVKRKSYINIVPDSDRRRNNDYSKDFQFKTDNRNKVENSEMNALITDNTINKYELRKIEIQENQSIEQCIKSLGIIRESMKQSKKENIVITTTKSFIDRQIRESKYNQGKKYPQIHSNPRIGLSNHLDRKIKLYDYLNILVEYRKETSNDGKPKLKERILFDKCRFLLLQEIAKKIDNKAGINDNLLNDINYEMKIFKVKNDFEEAFHCIFGEELFGRYECNNAEYMRNRFCNDLLNRVMKVERENELIQLCIQSIKDIIEMKPQHIKNEIPKLKLVLETHSSLDENTRKNFEWNKLLEDRTLLPEYVSVLRQSDYKLGIHEMKIMALIYDYKLNIFKGIDLESNEQKSCQLLETFNSSSLKDLNIIYNEENNLFRGNIERSLNEKIFFQRLRKIMRNMKYIHSIEEVVNYFNLGYIDHSNRKITQKIKTISMRNFMKRKREKMKCDKLLYDFSTVLSSCEF